ncbi:hypothetical protein V5799_024703 [Amblyomma americanum]|uniref:Uncharacterized protein n=1 Tax=Amblyomma americanum TaxID=6943 RepID=A0AAQ4EB90_AMBAM
MRAELRSVKDSLKFCSDSCDETKVTSSDIKALRKEISDLVSSNENIRAENKRLAQKVEELEQNRCLNNLKIKGVNSDIEPREVIEKIG